MKLLQLNTWSCKLTPEIIRLLNDENPDFICMQEVVHADFGGKILDTIDDILTEHPFTDYYYTPLVEFSFMHRRASRGNLIGATIPIEAKNELWTRGRYTEDFDYIDSGGYNTGRNIAHATFIVNDQPLHILTLHGYHISEHKNGNEETEKACRILVDYAASLSGGVIITGDFNLTPESPSIQLVSTAFRNLSHEAKLTTTRNHLTSKTEVCDYIFTNDKIQIVNSRMSDRVASDHNALILEFTV